MNNTVLVLLLGATLLAGAFFMLNTEKPVDPQQKIWEQYKAQHAKNYDPKEEQFRFNIFKQNLGRIQTFQENDKDAQYGITVFADLSEEEFKTHYLGYRRPAGALLAEKRDYYMPLLQEAPAAWDWRDHGAVTPVKNQGQCGSCWSFSATQNIEGQHFLKHGELLVLAEQELVDCDKVDQGCNGGLMENAFEFVKNQGGIEKEEDYPYQAQDGQCKFNPAKVAAKVTGYLNVTTDETEIAKSLVELGPLSIAVNAGPWQFYMGGITNPWFCNNELDHGVLLVGYGTGNNFLGPQQDYWIIKNSWGEGWGEKGYIRLVRGKGVCGVNLDVTTSQVA